MGRPVFRRDGLELIGERFLVEILLNQLKVFLVAFPVPRGELTDQHPGAVPIVFARCRADVGHETLLSQITL